MRTITDAQIVDTLRGLRTGSATGGPLSEILYGRRKMTAWLQRSGQEDVSKHTVDRLMRREGMRGLIRGRKIRTTIPGKDGVRAGDLLNRDFRTTAPNRAWVTDFERHEALLNRAVVKGHRHRPVAAGWLKLRAA